MSINQKTTHRKMKKIIRLVPKGEAVSDFEISKFVDEIVSSEKTEFLISTNLVINEIRARIFEKRIKRYDFEIYAEDVLLHIDEDGRIRNPQKSQDVNSDILDRLFGF